MNIRQEKKPDVEREFKFSFDWYPRASTVCLNELKHIGILGIIPF